MFKIFCDTTRAVLIKLLCVIDGIPAKQRGMVVITLAYCVSSRDLPLIDLANSMMH